MRLLVRFLISFWLLAGLAHANDNVIEVIAEVEGSSPMDAQQQAIDYAKKRAFFLVLSRHAPHEKAEEIAASLTSAQIESHIRGYELLQDKLDPENPNYYLAKYAVTISDAMVQRLVTADTMAVSNDDANPLVVLPVLRDADAVMLWEDQNIWRSIWNSIALEAGEGLLIMPYGDPNDTLYVNSSTVLGLGFDGLKQISERYGAGEAAVVVATYAKDRTPQGLEVIIRRLGPDVNKVKSLYFEVDNQEQTPESLMPQAARVIAEELKTIARTYQGEQLKRVANANKTKLHARFRRLQEWVAIKEKLSALPRVVQLNIDNITITDAQAVLLYDTDQKNMLEILQASGLYVAPKGDTWEIQVP